MLLKFITPVLLLPALAAADVVVLDTFTDAGRNNGTDLQDLAWYTSAGSGSLAIYADSTLDPSSSSHNVMRFNNSGGGYLFATLPGTLAVDAGTSVRLSLSFRDLGANGISVGLFSSNGTAAPAADGSNIGNIANDSGFFVSVRPTLIKMTADKGTNGTIFYGDKVDGTTVNFANTLDTNPHTLVLTLSYDSASGNTKAVATIDGGSEVSVLWSGNTFDEIFMSQVSGTGVDLRFDNIQVETLSVPEPASLAFVALVGLSLLMRKRP